MSTGTCWRRETVKNTLEKRKVMRNQIWQTEVTVFGKLPQMLVKGYFIKPLLHYNAVLQIVPQKVGCYKKVHKVKSGAKEDDLSNINKRLPK